MTIKAIETRYAGCHFRSRLEARWAVFFDVLGISWEYKPQGFQLPSCWYLPDFWLPDLDAWWEVKGEELPENEVKPQCELAMECGKRVYTAYGSIPRYITERGYSPERRGIEYVERFRNEVEFDLSGDIDYAFCACPWCGRIGLEYEGRSARICGWRKHHSNPEDALAVIEPAGHWRVDDKCYTADNPRISKAYIIARSARFEHGDSPDVNLVSQSWP
jgi:hypothetical protein